MSYVWLSYKGKIMIRIKEYVILACLLFSITACIEYTDPNDRLKQIYQAPDLTQGKRWVEWNILIHLIYYFIKEKINE